MTQRCYHIEPQRLRPDHGYVACEPHRATRFVVIETTSVPKRLGRRAYQIKKNVGIFSGSGAHLQARYCCDGYTARTKPRPSTYTRPEPLARSCTRAEYDAIIERSKGNG